MSDDSVIDHYLVCDTLEDAEGLYDIVLNSTEHLHSASVVTVHSSRLSTDYEAGRFMVVWCVYIIDKGED